ncbi:hypothetical protein M3J09_012577 [Ascochyta lentis]
MGSKHTSVEEPKINTPSKNDPNSMLDKMIEDGEAKAKAQDLESPQSGNFNVVDWNGLDDPENPKNWSPIRKWTALFVVSAFAFISPMSSSMVAPALEQIGNSLHTQKTIESQFFLSIFLLAYAVGPSVLGPLSETYGRVRVLQIANLLYLVFNLACGFSTTAAQMLVFRFFSGLGGSAPLAIGGGVIGDLFQAHERGYAVSVYSLAPLLGPAIGWIFWATTIADAVIQIGGMFLLQETYAPTLLARRCRALRRSTGNPELELSGNGSKQSKAATHLQAGVRPFRMLLTQPIIQFLAFYMAYVYGLMYLVLSTFPNLWSEIYHESISVGSLNYIGLGLGFFLGSQVAPRLNDKIYVHLQSRNQGVGKPEYRLLPILFGSLAVPLGLFIYGWAGEKKTMWLVPDVGIFVFALGTIICFQCAQTYLLDTYTRYAASAFAAVNVLRSLAGCGFPLFGPSMYVALGYGWGCSLLAFVSIVVGMPATWVLWQYGQHLRLRSQYAAG